MIAIATFSCEACGEVHVSGEAPFVVSTLTCAALGMEILCRERRALRELNRTYSHIGHFGLSAALQSAYRRGRTDGQLEFFGHAKTPPGQPPSGEGQRA